MNSEYKSTTPQPFVLFSNSICELYSEDHSILHVDLGRTNKIVYISPKGIKNLLSISQISKIADLSIKFNNCIQKVNCYTKEHKYFYVGNSQMLKDKLNQNDESNRKKQIFGKAVKLQQFRWDNIQVQQTKCGYRVKSDCQQAQIVLRKDLFIVQVRYPQLVDTKRAYASRKPNMTKILLQKYNYEYNEFPSQIYEKQSPQYLYLWQQRIFPIYEVPVNWQYPLSLIWQSLIHHNIIEHKFKYLQYNYQKIPKTTLMPEVVLLDDQKNVKDVNKHAQTNSKDDLDDVSTRSFIPILGKINHNQCCLFFEVGSVQAWIGKNWNILCDSYGFWEFDQMMQYRKINKPEIQTEYHPQAIPYTIRFKNENERSIIKQLKLFLSYVVQNMKIRQVQLNKRGKETAKFDSENNLVNQQLVQDVGDLKAYSNGVVIVNFIDRCLLTLNSKRMEIKIIRNDGQVCYVDLHKAEGINYQQNKLYIAHALDFQQRTFYPEQWREKQQIHNQISESIQDTETFQKTSSSYLNR